MGGVFRVKFCLSILFPKNAEIKELIDGHEHN